MFLPFHLLKYYNPKILRRLVRDKRDDMEEQQSMDVYDSKINVQRSIFKGETAKWKLKAYDLQDLNKICLRFMEMSNIVEPSDYKDWTKDMVVKYLEPV